ncbi:MAG: radical SAM/SPASM domain-containing protein [Bacteroidales bacterium]
MSSLSHKPVVLAMPVALSAELTNKCNLACPECDNGAGLMTRAKGFMSLELFDKIISELGSCLYNINLYFQGEPMLHPQFFCFIAKSRKISTVVSTNGHFLNEENADKLACSGLNQLVVSLDGMDQVTYSSYRINGDFDTVISGIRNVSEAVRRNNSTMKMVIQFLVSRKNEHQISQARRFAKGMNALLRLKSMQIINNNTHGEWLPLKAKFSRYENKCNLYTLKNDLPGRCARLWSSPVITWDGMVLPCCFDKDARYVMGDLNEESFRDIWDGPRYRLFRKRILSGRHAIDICGNCTSGLRGVAG